MICFEESAVGDDMGRLECLCKFHKVSLPIQRFLGGDNFSYGETTEGVIRHVYGNGGIRKAQGEA